MITFSNQYDFRVDNQLKVIAALQNGQQSLNDLAEKLDISFTAISKIINQLIDYDIVKRVNKKVSTSKRGRAPVLVKLNTSVGVTCAIDLSSHCIVVTLNSLTGKIICQKIFPDTLFIGIKQFVEIKDAIKELLLHPDIDGRKLLGICISCPGMIDKETGDVVECFRLKLDECPSPINFFFNEFGVPVQLYNDAKIACFGEMTYGSIPKDAKNFLFLHIGSVVGAAIVISGKQYFGNNGFTGEFSNFKDNLKDCQGRNKIFGLWWLSHLVSEKDPSLSLEISKENFVFDFEKAAKLYKENNPVFLECLEEIAKLDAIQLIAYNDFLDFEYIVIEGSILNFKDKFREYLLKYLNTSSIVPFKAKVLFSNLEGQASLKGTIYRANRHYFMKKLEEITNERSVGGNYNINESFSDDI